MADTATTTATMTLAGAINAGLRAAMERDPKVLLMGEDIGALGGVFRVTDGLHKDFGGDRVMDTPLAESGIVGTAIGLAMRGYRPVVEIQFDGFIFPAYDQITTSLAKLHARSGGEITVPVVIRVPYAGGIGAVGFDGDMDIAIALRTMVIPTAAAAPDSKEWTVHLQAGAGIVADSVPAAEYEETVSKAAALGRAIDLAESAFAR